mmetsp:Transcript_15476/g.43334  ORF Transcript_15476/g.43334 Transcript_15476/m.43334 type:complete len:687 (+) Transcript_15476:362-2422(+)
MDDIGNENCDDAMPQQEASAADAALVLVGAPGQEFVSTMLSTKDPQTAIGEVKAKASLPARCTPLLELLDQLGATRSESHRYLLQAARALLLESIARMPPDKLLHLLESSFAFIGIPDLRAIPLAVLSRLEPVPATFLKQLSIDRELFNELPNGVQRQVWELDRKLLQQHALPKVMEYAQEPAIIKQALDMSECLRVQRHRKLMSPNTGSPGGDAAPAATGFGLPRTKLRSQSKALQELVQMVGVSRLVYRGIVELCRVKFRDSEYPYVSVQDTGLCILRSQLLMALHDKKAVELCRTEQSHKLAWIIDACLRDHLLDEKRLRELHGFFQLYDGVGKQDGKRKGKSARRGDHEYGGGDAESAGGLSHAPSDEPGRVLGEAGLVLRDPATLHLLLSFVLQQLERGVKTLKLPADNNDLVFVTRLLQLAMSARTQLHERRYTFPDASNLILRSLYPLINCYMADTLIAKLKGRQRELPANLQELLNADLVEILAAEELARAITMMFTLDRLIDGDGYTAAVMLACLGALLVDSNHKSHSTWSSFGFSLVAQLRRMVSKGALKPDNLLWETAVDGIAMRLLDAEAQIQEQVVALLVLAAPSLSDDALIAYIKRVVKETKKSRRRFKKARARAEDADPAEGAAAVVAPVAGAAAAASEPLCQAAYHKLCKKLEGRVNEENCPELFLLLSS